MPTSTVTSKGQITIPKEIREQLNLKTGNRLEFCVDRSGQVILKPRHKDIRALRGILRSRRRRPVSLKEMNEAAARGWAGT